MVTWTGYFANSGSPSLKVTISGPFTDGLEYEGIIDTGFTGFLSIPIIEGIRLGLVLHGTTKVSFADGSDNYRLTAKAMVKVHDKSNVGVAILEPSSTEVLIGMDFLRLFKRALFVSHDLVTLVDEDELEKAVSASKPPTKPDTQTATLPETLPIKPEAIPSKETPKSD
jgi:predicted aspartyl protease